MHSLVPWTPYNELEAMRRQMTTLFTGKPEDAREFWTPAVDIFEDDHSYIFRAELPEVKKSDVDVQLENGLLTIAGERKAEKEQAIRRVHRIERAYGAFLRTFELPSDVDPERVEATFKEGVLTVVIHKADHAKPRKVEVKVA
jgi:HSP20 family protein